MGKEIMVLVIRLRIGLENGFLESVSLHGVSKSSDWPAVLDFHLRHVIDNNWLGMAPWHPLTRLATNHLCCRSSSKP